MLERRDVAPGAQVKRKSCRSEAWHGSDAAIGSDRKLSAAEIGVLERNATVESRTAARILGARAAAREQEQNTCNGLSMVTPRLCGVERICDRRGREQQSRV
jgi:hypothetical protein